jgi:O-methyltransferase
LRCGYGQGPADFALDLAPATLHFWSKLVLSNTPENNRADQEAPTLYLQLIKKTLGFSLWEDPGKPLEAVAYRAGPLRFVVDFIAKALSKVRLRIVVLRDMKQETRIPGSTWPSYAHTMVGTARLDNLQCAVETILRESVPGDLIETGVWRGGCCMLMKAVLMAYGDRTRRVFVADSFQGLPKPDVSKAPADAGDQHHEHEFLEVSKEQVEGNFRKYGLLDERVVFLKGWFKDTLPLAPFEKLAVMRLDGDMYESTMDALSSLYDRLSPGGFCIIDDYALAGCKKAVDDFRTVRKISEPLIKIDYSGCYWRKQ